MVAARVVPLRPPTFAGRPRVFTTELRLDHVVRRYGRLVAVNELSLAVRPGETFGLLGPNGAGKSTLMRMMLGADEPDAGSITLGEQAADAADLGPLAASRTSSRAASARASASRLRRSRSTAICPPPRTCALRGGSMVCQDACSKSACSPHWRLRGSVHGVTIEFACSPAACSDA